MTWPELTASDRLLADELERRGHVVEAVPWNGPTADRFAHADMVVFRSNWDYHHHVDDFEDWLTGLEAAGVELRNPAPLVRWALDKRRLVDLIDTGLRMPHTLALDPIDGESAVSWAKLHDLDRVVLKPVWGASGHGVALVTVPELAAHCDRIAAMADRRPYLVQEYMPEIVDGEIALVFFNGEFSHALLRSPADDDFRVNGQYGGSTSRAVDVDADLIDFGAKVGAMLPGPATYLRVDLVRDRGGYAVMEIEVNEPGLGLDLAPGSAARFASALLG